MGVTGVNYALQRVKNNQNFLAIACGQTGSGKSWLMVKYFELLYKAQGKDPLNYLHHIVFRVEDFIELLNSGKLEKGDVILFDEIGIEGNNRQWYSLTNKALNYTVQTFRHLNLIVLFTAPSFDYVDSAVRKLFHAYIETVKIVRSSNETIAKFQLLQFNPRMSSLYNKYPVIRNKNGITKIKRIRVKAPSVKLRNRYDIMQKEYKKCLGEDLANELIKKKESQKKKQIVDDDTIIKSIIDNKDDYIKKNNRLNKGLIMQNFNIGRVIAEKIKDIAESRLGLC